MVYNRVSILYKQLCKVSISIFIWLSYIPNLINKRINKKIIKQHKYSFYGKKSETIRKGKKIKRATKNIKDKKNN